MQDNQILGRVDELVAEEHTLRDKLQAGELTTSEERARLKTVEQELDQCWDLLRQRRAKRESGDNPDEAQARPVGEVEGYLQ